MQEMQVRSLGQEDPPEEDMASHSSILAWRTPRTEEPGGLQSTGLKEWDSTEVSWHAARPLEPPSCPLPHAPS